MLLRTSGCLSRQNVGQRQILPVKFFPQQTVINDKLFNGTDGHLAHNGIAIKTPGAIVSTCGIGLTPVRAECGCG